MSGDSLLVEERRGRIVAVSGSRDAVEGATAYVEKRDPVWQAR
ncbi:MAG: hypothetical protein ACLFXM_00195 [Acidimicrobiia bacterium]